MKFKIDFFQFQFFKQLKVAGKIQYTIQKLKNGKKSQLQIFSSIQELENDSNEYKIHDRILWITCWIFYYVFDRNLLLTMSNTNFVWIFLWKLETEFCLKIDIFMKILEWVFFKTLNIFMKIWDLGSIASKRLKFFMKIDDWLLLVKAWQV